jgi:serine/threonine protein kinase
VVELLTGSPPYFNLEAMAAMYRIVVDPVPPLPPNLASDLKDFLLLCFNKVRCCTLCIHILRNQLTPVGQDSSSRPSARALLKHPWIANHCKEDRDDVGDKVSRAAEAVGPVEEEAWDIDFPDAAATKSLSVRTPKPVP